MKVENKHIKRCPISFVIIEMQIIIAMRYHGTPTKMVKKPKQKQAKEKPIASNAEVDSEQGGL